MPRAESGEPALRRASPPPCPTLFISYKNMWRLCALHRQAKSAERIPLLAVGERGTPTASSPPATEEADVYDGPPEDAASCCSRALFCWNVRLMRKGVCG